MKRLPKEVFTGIYGPPRRLVEFQVEKRNVVGALASITKLLESYKINLCSGFLTAHPNEPTSLFSFIADMSEAVAEPEKVAEELRGLEVVINVRFQEPRMKGMMVDEAHFPLLAVGERSVLLRVASIGSMFRRLFKTFGPPAGVILYEMGVSAGREKIEGLKSRYGLEGREALVLALAERTAKGWGVVEVKELNEEEGRVLLEVQELFECLPFRGEVGPGSYFFRGYLEGALSQALGRGCQVVEGECIAKGGEKCTFRGTLGRLSERVKVG